MTNGEFARRVGCHLTMASRLRNGLRKPSVEMLDRIANEFGLPHSELMSAHVAGREEFGKYLRQHVFRTESEKPETAVV